MCHICSVYCTDIESVFKSNNFLELWLITNGNIYKVAFIKLFKFLHIICVNIFSLKHSSWVWSVIWNKIIIIQNIFFSGLGKGYIFNRNSFNDWSTFVIWVKFWWNAWFQWLFSGLIFKFEFLGNLSISLLFLGQLWWNKTWVFSSSILWYCFPYRFI